MKRDKADCPQASEFNHAAYKAGCRFYDAGNFKKAILAFREALDYWPEDVQAWLAIGNCFDAIKKPQRSEKCFLHALQFAKSEDKDTIQFNLGNSLFDQNRFTEAIRVYDKIAPGTDLGRSSSRNIALARERLGEQ